MLVLGAHAPMAGSSRARTSGSIHPPSGTARTSRATTTSHTPGTAAGWRRVPRVPATRHAPGLAGSYAGAETTTESPGRRLAASCPRCASSRPVSVPATTATVTGLLGSEASIGAVHRHLPARPQVWPAPADSPLGPPSAGHRDGFARTRTYGVAAVDKNKEENGCLLLWWTPTCRLSTRSTR